MVAFYFFKRITYEASDPQLAKNTDTVKNKWAGQNLNPPQDVTRQQYPFSHPSPRTGHQNNRFPVSYR